MIPAARTPIPTKPKSGVRPRRNAPDAPVAPTSDRASPAKDWPRITVNTPTTPETSATTVPMIRAE
jgi:hypothetical protein